MAVGVFDDAFADAGRSGRFRPVGMKFGGIGKIGIFGDVCAAVLRIAEIGVLFGKIIVKVAQIAIAAVFAVFVLNAHDFVVNARSRNILHEDVVSARRLPGFFSGIARFGKAAVFFQFFEVIFDDSRRRRRRFASVFCFARGKRCVVNAPSVVNARPDIVHVGVGVCKFLFEVGANSAQRIVDFFDGDGRAGAVDIVFQVAGTGEDRRGNRHLHDAVQQASVGCGAASGAQFRRAHPKHASLARGEHDAVFAHIEHVQPQAVAHFGDDVAKLASVHILFDELAVIGVLQRAHARLKPPLDERSRAKYICKLNCHNFFLSIIDLYL